MRPILRFRETYPEPFYVPPHQLAEVIHIVQDEVNKSDMLYIHDGELPFHFIYDEIPTVISFQDFVYPDTLSSAMSFERDELIVASDYVKHCVEDTIGQYRIGLTERIHVVPNGIDLDLFRATEPLIWQSDLKSRGFYLVGCPHRPDPTKGLQESVRLIAMLKGKVRAGEPQPMLLIPRWIDSRINPDDGHIYRTLYDTLLKDAEQLGIADNIHLHDWIPGSDIARYYSGCNVVVAIGSFVEAYGNVPVEAAACGIPSVVAQVAGHIGKLTSDISTEVPPKDLLAARDAVLRSLDHRTNYHAVRQELHQRFGLKRMVEGYRQVIEHVKLKPPLLLSPQAGKQFAKLAAWCRFIDGRVYNDYQHDYLDDPELRALFDKPSDPTMGPKRISKALIAANDLDRWTRGGYVVACD